MPLWPSMAARLNRSFRETFPSVRWKRGGEKLASKYTWARRLERMHPDLREVSRGGVLDEMAILNSANAGGNGMWKSLYRLVCASALAVALIAPANAWDKVTSGNISVIEVTAGSNYGFRVWLLGGVSPCSSGIGWAYLLDTDSNYRTFVASLLMAKATGAPVTFHTELEGGYCHIRHISF